MSQVVLTNLDLSKNQLISALAQVVGADVSSPAAGQFWYRSDLGVLTFQNASAAIRLGRLDQITAPNAQVDLNSQKVVNLATPTNPGDAVTKAYVDGIAGGNVSWKNPVRVATVTNGTLASAFANGQTVDGVVLVTGDRILIKDQSAGQDNGIYTVNASGAPTRATDADTATEITGAATFSLLGTSNADSAWVMTTDSVTLGTTPQVWVQFSGAGQVTAGAGLTKTGNLLDVGGTANRITVAADTVDIAATYTGQASITTLGTITTGTWTASVVGSAYGGTGIASPTAASVLVTQAAGAMTVASGSAANTVLRRGPAGDPAFGSIDLSTAMVSGVLGAPGGGTGIASPTAASVLVTQGASAMSVAAGSAANTVLRRGPTGDPTFGAVDLATAQVTGTLPLANGGGYTTAATAKTALGFMSRYVQTVGDGSAVAIVVTHNLNTKDAHVSVYRTATPWDQVICDVEMTSVNTVTLRFAVAPSAGQYSVAIIG